MTGFGSIKRSWSTWFFGGSRSRESLRVPPSPRERETAARIRVVADKATGKKTPDWIRKLAGKGG